MSVMQLNINEVTRDITPDDRTSFVEKDVNVDTVRLALPVGFTDLAIESGAVMRVMYIRPGESQVRSATADLAESNGLFHFFDWHLTAADLEEVWKLKQESTWDDLFLFGTEFQKKVWRKLWDLSHQENGTSQNTGLISYSDFAELCQNRAGVRAVAHAIGLNPVSVIIPCHLVIPKESIDKIKEIHKKAEATIFKGDDLCINSILSDSSIDFGEYALGRKLKRKLILKELANGLL
jgi:O-6-methylguanine DNA methyltransferase